MATTPDAFTLVTGASWIAIDAEGRLLDLGGNGTTWHARPGPFWQITLQAPSNDSVLGRRRKAVPAAAPTIERSGASMVLHYAGLQVDSGDAAVDVDVDATISAADGEFVFTFAVTNRSAVWTVREIRAPLVAAPLRGQEGPALLWPMGAGERFPDPGQARVMSAAYPMRLFMPWLALDAGDSGLYLGVHDASLQTVKLNVDACRLPGTVGLSVSLFPFCAPGETSATAPVVVRPYSGAWREAAKRYRRWADAWFKPVERPDWVREASGWLLVILKQQNGEILWPYTDLEKVIESAKANGLNVLGLFGWTEGGHDRRYPIYEPDPAMGGETALREGIAKAHAAGLKVILYTNGQLRDILTDWHDECGLVSAALSERGEPFGESWRKYNDAPPRPMTYGCQSSQVWSDTLLDLAKKVEALGADGIIFDQLGSCQPMFCFSNEHNHAKPSLATGPGVAANLARVQREMHKINPDFIVIVEHVADAVNQHVDFTHGCGAGFSPEGRAFPEMLRFTLPEIVVTQRHATPVMDRNTANWACLYGFLHEVEYRYRPDRLYVEQGITPEVVDYERICAPPNIQLMRKLDPVEAAAYLRKVIEFEQRNADIFRRGVFRDSLGFEIDNPAVRAKAFANGDTLGIVLWNPTDEPQVVKVTVQSAEFVGADAPGGEIVDMDAPIPATSVRLVRYARSSR